MTEKHNNNQSTVNTSNKKSKILSPGLREAAQKVLNHLSLEPNYGNYRLYDPIMDWRSLTRSIDHFTRIALCNVIDNYRRKVVKDGQLVQVAIEIADCGDSQAAEILAKKSYEFVKWW